ncbi:hypothetical protein GPECTOR_19g339 [Gonium pectorale]|uniref:Uncharacterized protein n=1 Tax=Gonium pectorale TaxID=33097 RepID=A0A150GJA3_GONPE|nr:hypothetical protein GPECTOR_19g339 [Gonium pectorale]|eukprot:KXZ49888.1 hypothetical protein GPECTOR_19g339 [Gonium pectorale]
MWRSGKPYEELRELSLDLRLSAYEATCHAAVDGLYGGTASVNGDGELTGQLAAELADGLANLTHLTRLELGEAGSVPHPDWRVRLLASLARLPRLAELTWPRLECDAAASRALATCSSLTALSVEKFRAPGPLAAVTLAAAATAGGTPASPADGNAAADGAVGAPGLSITAPTGVAVARMAAAGAGQEAREAAPAAADVDSAAAGCHPMLLPLPPNLRRLTARYSGLGGVSIAALAALQLPPGLEQLQLRNPKLEIGDTDVQQPAGTRLLPVAALALGLGLAKLATHCPGLHTLRVINESRQRNALAAPVGWARDSGGGGGGAGGGHAPWLSALSGLRSLRRLTLSGLQLGKVDAEALARCATGLEELYLVPLGSVSSAAVPVLRGMGLRRLVLPYERHA